jgi:flagellar basal-body rod protein FlgB
LNKNSFEITPTGGTVVVEEQMMKVAQNATDYQMTTSLYNKIGNMYKVALGLSPGA